MSTWSLRLKLILYFTFGAALTVAMGTYGNVIQNTLLQAIQTSSQRVSTASTNLWMSSGELELPQKRVV